MPFSLLNGQGWLVKTCVEIIANISSLNYF